MQCIETGLFFFSGIRLLSGHHHYLCGVRFRLRISGVQRLYLSCVIFNSNSGTQKFFWSLEFENLYTVSPLQIWALIQFQKSSRNAWILISVFVSAVVPILHRGCTGHRLGVPLWLQTARAKINQRLNHLSKFIYNPTNTSSNGLTCWCPYLKRWCRA